MFGKIKQRFKTEEQYNQYKVFEVQNQIWDWQFKRFKNRVERERYRVEYDNTKAKREQLLQVIEQQANAPTMTAEDIARLPDEKERMGKDLKNYEDLMKQCDNELTGLPPSAEVPMGQSGIETMLEALRDLAEVHKAYIKSL